MPDTRADTLFNLRYAVRVLERYAHLWHNAGVTLKFSSILSGTAALASLTGQVVLLAVAAGIFFAVMQALELALAPADRATAASLQRREYARLLAQGCQLGDEALAAQYAGLVAEDGIHVPQGLKLIAYNDVVRERGLDSAALYTNTNRLLACLS